MTEVDDHPGKLRGIYLKSYVSIIIAAFVLAAAFLYFGLIEAFFFSALNSIFAIPTAYFGLRIGNSHAVSLGWDNAEKGDAVAWFFYAISNIGLVFTERLLFENHTSRVGNIVGSIILMSALISYTYAFYMSGRKLAWLAGDKTGARSTFLRFLQLAYWPITFNYINQHIRESKRPFKADHP